MNTLVCWPTIQREAHRDNRAQYLTPDRHSIPTSLVKGQQPFTPILEPIKLKLNPRLKVKQKKAKEDDRDKC